MLKKNCHKVFGSQKSKLTVLERDFETAGVIHPPHPGDRLKGKYIQLPHSQNSYLTIRYSFNTSLIKIICWSRILLLGSICKRIITLKERKEEQKFVYLRSWKWKWNYWFHFNIIKHRWQGEFGKLEFQFANACWKSRPCRQHFGVQTTLPLVTMSLEA